MTTGWERALVALGALAGFGGVALSALAAHLTGGGSLDVAARFLLAHAPVLLAVALLLERGAVRRGLGRAAGIVIALGLVLFCGDLSVRALTGLALLPMAAPTGGVMLMVGWFALGVAALTVRRR